MRKILLSMLVVIVFIAFSCTKDVDSERFVNLTSNIWTSDSLLVGGVDASGPNGLLEVFNGDVVFNKDLTGTFGAYKGSWYFAYNETKIVLSSDSLLIPLSMNIEELSKVSFKVTTEFPTALDPANPLQIRMTFKAK